jgi:hypothetical protein
LREGERKSRIVENEKCSLVASFQNRLELQNEERGSQELEELGSMGQDWPPRAVIPGKRSQPSTCAGR